MASAEIAADVRRGLSGSPKSIDPRWFYDALGSALFTAICELPEYYVTRAEREILGARSGEIVAAFSPPIVRLVELGSGNAQKTRTLIKAVLKKQNRLTYRPIDVDAGMLDATKRELAAVFPSLSVQPHQGDFHDIASLGTAEARTVVLFLGSSIGNLDHRGATSLLQDVRKILGPGDGAFIGFDLRKPVAILESAYNDALGVTAAFNLNVLARINRELQGTFRLDRFTHRAFFNDKESRIEMHLVSTVAQTVHIGELDLDVTFAAGETIHTENSYKYDRDSIAALAKDSGLRIEKEWTDSRGWFSDVLLRPV